MAARSADESHLPFWLRGNFAPVSEEVTAVDLEVEGALPPEMHGTYVRNGPNPREGRDPGHWFLGDGMLHGVRIAGGRARWYRNRWVRTRSFLENAGFIDEQGNVDRTIGLANTHVISHAGRILALVESSFPTEVDEELETVGTYDFGGRLATAMTAHPKICPKTGELHFFGYGFFPPLLTYHVADRSGALVKSEEITIPAAVMMHDFAITDRHVVFLDLPIVFDPERALSGSGFPFVWSDDHGARVGVMPRGGGNADVRWLEIEPCYVFHPFNAWEDDGRIVVDVCRYATLWRGGPESFDPALLHRWTIDLDEGRVGEETLDDLPIEFPRVNDALGGLRNRYGYAVSNAGSVGDASMQIVKYDFDTGAREIHDCGPGRMPSEVSFVPAPGESVEDAGWLVGYVYDEDRGSSDLVVLDATDVAAKPVARVRLPARVPFGFHGSWIADRD